jgi:DnaK suppressor protein
MDNERAAELLRAERAEVERLLRETVATGTEDREAVADAADADPGDLAQPRTEEQVDSAIVASLHERLAAIDRADQRLSDGTFGRSVLSGEPIPDERLEVAPTAELTVAEAEAQAEDA